MENVERGRLKKPKSADIVESPKRNYGPRTSKDRHQEPKDRYEEPWIPIILCMTESNQEEGPKKRVPENEERKDALGTYILSHHHHVLLNSDGLFLYNNSYFYEKVSKNIGPSDSAKVP